MNLNYDLDKQMQYDYLFHAVRKRKRPFQKWIKPENDKQLNAIKLYFNISNQKAKETLNILTEQQIKEIVGKVKSRDQK
jgi:hypothetical protein